jgi:hypothetical protein
MEFCLASTMQAFNGRDYFTQRLGWLQFRLAPQFGDEQLKPLNLNARKENSIA